MSLIVVEQRQSHLARTVSIIMFECPRWLCQHAASVSSLPPQGETHLVSAHSAVFRVMLSLSCTRRHRNNKQAAQFMACFQIWKLKKED